MSVRARVVQAWQRLTRGQRQVLRNTSIRSGDGVSRLRCKIIMALVQGKTPSRIAGGLDKLVVQAAKPQEVQAGPRPTRPGPTSPWPSSRSATWTTRCAMHTKLSRPFAIVDHLGAGRTPACVPGGRKSARPGMSHTSCTTPPRPLPSSKPRVAWTTRLSRRRSRKRTRRNPGTFEAARRLPRASCRSATWTTKLSRPPAGTHRTAQALSRPAGRRDTHFAEPRPPPGIMQWKAASTEEGRPSLQSPPPARLVT